MRHELVDLYPVPSGWRAVCACGHECRGPHQHHALSAWHDHVVEMTGAVR